MENKKNTKKFKFLEHTADIKFRAFGNSVGEVFENSALALREIISEGKIKEKIKKQIKVTGEDYESLLYNFLEELLFLFDSEGFILSRAKNLEIKKNKLTATLTGDLAENYEINEHIKAVTYNEMFVREEKRKWTAQVVVDV
jgi:SHS2 domain-containing protein